MWGGTQQSAGAIIREPKAGAGPVAATAGMPKFVNLTGVAAALNIANVDTGAHIIWSQPPGITQPCSRRQQIAF
jgi:hypothetical protein